MNRVDIEERYKKWWVGKFCRPVGQPCLFDKVANVKYHSSPSGVYGTVELIFEGGGHCYVGTGKFRASKKDVEIRSEI